MTTPTNYIPGVCNINPAEIRRRRYSGIFGIATALFGLIAFIYLHASWYYYIALFIPLFTGALGLLQAKHKFCVAYASTGKQHADSTGVQTISNADARSTDQIKARLIYIKSFLIAASATFLLCFIPLLYS